MAPSSSSPAPLLWVHHLNSLLCLLVGLPSNSLLLWLIFRRTSKEKKMYSQILMQSCIMDILLLLLAQLVQPVFFVENGVGHDLMASQFGWLPNPANHILFMCWFVAFYFSMVGLCVQFIYRYLVLCRSANIDSVRYFALLALAFLCQVPLIAFLSKSSYPASEHELFGNNAHLLGLLGNGPAENGSWRLALRAETRDPIVLGWFAMYLLYNTALYAIIIFCAIKIRASLAKQIAQFEVSKSSGELNGQITRTLLIQAFLPFFPLLITSIAVSSVLLLPQSSNAAIVLVQMLVTVPLSWLPVANPLVSLLIVKQYRKWLTNNLGRICLGKPAKRPANSKTTAVMQIVKVRPTIK